MIFRIPMIYSEEHNVKIFKNVFTMKTIKYISFTCYKKI